MLANGVSRLDGVRLKEAFVYAVQKLLLVAEVWESGGGALDGDVEVIETAKEFRAGEAFRNERLDQILDFMGNDVLADEVRVVEHARNEPLRKEMLDEHFVDGRCTEIRVQGLAAKIVETFESLLELEIACVGFLNFNIKS